MKTTPVLIVNAQYDFFIDTKNRPSIIIIIHTQLRLSVAAILDGDLWVVQVPPTFQTDDVIVYVLEKSNF